MSSYFARITFIAIATCIAALGCSNHEDSVADRVPESDRPAMVNAVNEEFPFRARVDFHVRTEDLNRYGLSVTAIDKEVQAYLGKRKTFSLSDLKSIEISAVDGTNVKLEEVVDVLVTFAR